jgi:hypothetical protein
MPYGNHAEEQNLQMKSKVTQKLENTINEMCLQILVSLEEWMMYNSLQN